MGTEKQLPAEPAPGSRVMGRQGEGAAASNAMGGAFGHLPDIPCSTNTFLEHPPCSPLPSSTASAPRVLGFQAESSSWQPDPNKEKHLRACLSVPVLPPLAGILGHFSVFPLLSLLLLSPPYLGALGTAVCGAGNELTLTSGHPILRIVNYFAGGPAGLQAASHKGTALPWHLCAPERREPHGEENSVLRPWQCCSSSLCGQLQ